MSTDQIVFRVAMQLDDTPVRGNVSAIGPEEDAKAERWVVEELGRGNVFAWCWVRVVASLGTFEGDDALGGISCSSREEFERTLLPEMKSNALASLRFNLESAVADGRRAELLLKRFDRLRKVDEEPR